MGRRFPRFVWILAGLLAVAALVIWNVLEPDRRRHAEARRLLMSELIRSPDLPPRAEWKTLGTDAVPVLRAALVAPDRSWWDILAGFGRVLGRKVGLVPANGSNSGVPASLLRSAAARVVPSLGTNAVVLLPALIRAQELQSVDNAVTDRLREFGPTASNAIPVLIRLFDADPYSPHFARAIVAIGMPASDWDRMASSPLPGIRLTGQVGASLSRGDTNQALEYLRAAMVDSSTLIGMAGYLAGDLGAAAAPLAPRMAERLNVGKWDLRWFWVERLGDLGPGAASVVGILLDRLDDESDPEVRRVLIRTLGRIGPAAKSALPRLEALRHGDDEVQIREAREAVERIESGTGTPAH